MSTIYKLTDQDGYTRRDEENACLWGPGVSHSGTGKGDLCGPGFVHGYEVVPGYERECAILALLMNPVHADIDHPRLWECEGEIAKRGGQLKCGCVTLTTKREIELPVIFLTQKIRFAILCATEVCTDKRWNAWADDWLSGKDRSAEAARAAARAAAWAGAWAGRAAAGAAAWAAAWAVAWAVAWAAAWAAQKNFDLLKIIRRSEA
jgi:hypothetical protein